MIQLIHTAMRAAHVSAVMTRVETVKTVTIPSRFNGPAGSANGGYVCGVLAHLIDGPAHVILRRPPPLGVEMRLERFESGGVALRHGEATIATATAAFVDLQPPSPPTFTEARDASARYGGLTGHPFPTCFVCGPSRAEADGLRIFPGSLAGASSVAAPWIPDDELADHDGLVRLEFVWAALDCPTGWATMILPPVGKVVVLGTLSADLRRRPHPGRRYVLAAWPIGSSGRKFLAGAALWSEAGDLHAVAQSTWIQVAGKGDRA